VFCTVYVFYHNISGIWRAGMIIASEAKVEAKIVKDAFAAGYMSGRVLLCTCVFRQKQTRGNEAANRKGRTE
jgi:hypothetical protein